MIRQILAATALAAATISAAPVFAADAPAAAAAKFNTADTTLGDLLDDAGAKAVLQKFIPDLIASPQIDMARGMTLKQMQNYAGESLSDAKLAQIDAELAKLPTK